jgi:hypothetical protein
MSLLLASSSAPAVKVLPIEMEKISVSPATATITFARNGSVTYTGGTYNWFTTTLLNVGDSYEINAEISTVPETSFIGTIGSWEPLTSSVSWTLTKAAGADTGSLLISIRKAGEATIMSTGLTVFIVEVIA